MISAFVKRFLIDALSVIEAFLIRGYLGEPLVYGFRDIFQDGWWVVGFSVHVKRDVAFLCVRIVLFTLEVKGDI